MVPVCVYTVYISIATITTMLRTTGLPVSTHSCCICDASCLPKRTTVVAKWTTLIWTPAPKAAGSVHKLTFMQQVVLLGMLAVLVVVVLAGSLENNAVLAVLAVRAVPAVLAVLAVLAMPCWPARKKRKRHAARLLLSLSTCLRPAHFRYLKNCHFYPRCDEAKQI